MSGSIIFPEPQAWHDLPKKKETAEWDMWEGALSFCTAHVRDSCFFGLFRRTASLSCFRTLTQWCWLTVDLRGRIHSKQCVLCNEKLTLERTDALCSVFEIPATCTANINVLFPNHICKPMSHHLLWCRSWSSDTFLPLEGNWWR